MPERCLDFIRKARSRTTGPTETPTRGQTARAACFLFAAALLLAAYRASLVPLPLSSTLVPNRTPPAAQAPSGVDLQDFLPKTGVSSHAASLAELADGAIACAWYSGSREAAPDSVIYLSLYRNGRWSVPGQIASPGQTQNDTRRFVKIVGNPVLFADNEGRLHLWYVSSIGGWSASAVNHRSSTDNGQTWSKAARLVTAPFFNLSTLVRMPPLLLAGGQFLLPTYHELATLHGETTRLAADGITVLAKTGSHPIARSSSLQ